jgi:hypothetical protein
MHFIPAAASCGVLRFKIKTLLLSFKATFRPFLTKQKKNGRVFFRQMKKSNYHLIIYKFALARWRTGSSLIPTLMW